MKKAVAVIITNNKDEVLLLKRGFKQRNEQGKWENCGGEVDEGETYEVALRREVKEELNIGLINLERLFIDSDPAGNWEVVVFKANNNGEPINNEQEFIDEVKWFNKSDLKNVDLASYTKRDFKRLRWI